jgi:hypothetical protein
MSLWNSPLASGDFCYLGYGLLNILVTSCNYFLRMKSWLAMISLLFIISACRKNDEGGEINGSWKLIEVYDKTTGTINHPHAGSNMDVVITFFGSNSFAGHTLRNSLSDGRYKQTGNEIMFEGFSMTKIAEDQWGGSFLTALNACLLQSTYPCVPSIISIQGNIMKLTTSLRYDVTLQRL